MYDAADRRWLSMDLAKDGINWYSYCGNNPINFVDWAGFLAVSYQGGANIEFKINYSTGELEINFMQSIFALKKFSYNTVLYGSPQRVGPGADQYNIYYYRNYDVLELEKTTALVIMNYVTHSYFNKLKTWFKSKISKWECQNSSGKLQYSAKH